MRILFLGDIVGRAAREAVARHIPDLRRDLSLDFVIVNAENAAGGFGVTAEITANLLEAGADVITTGNHVWDQPKTSELLESEPRILRPDNYPAQTPGRGGGIFPSRNGGRVCVINLMGRLFMPTMIDDPFASAVKWLETHALGGDLQALIVDMHAESVSEKMAMGHLCDGRASLVVGSHTHAPTSDERVLPKGTAYMTDAGMCGDYSSVVGFEAERPLERFMTGRVTGRQKVAMGEPTLCGALVETDPDTGLALTIAPFRMGGVLSGAYPSDIGNARDH